MTSDAALDLVSQLFRLALLLSLPLLGVILVVGLIISILQVVTQVQDPSIAFVPKLVIFGVVLMFLGPWMVKELTTFGVSMFSRLAQ